MGGTDRSTLLRSDERSTSPKCVFHFTEMRVPLHRNTHKTQARRILALNDEIAALDRLIEPLVEELAPRLLALSCVGVESAGEFLVTAGDNPLRLRSEVVAAT